MKVCIVGAGGIGGLLAVKFSQAGEAVTVVDRGLHLDAMRSHGLSLKMADGTESTTTDLRVTGKISQDGSTDLIILAVKAHQIADVAADLSPLYGSDTSVLTVQNGIPWWYFQRHGGELDSKRLQKLDPEGLIAQHIPAERILGCVAYPACELAAPGMIRHIEGNRFPVGELDGCVTERATTAANLFNNAGLKSYVIDDIRAEIWLKAWGALCFNPISALTNATMVDICQHDETRKLVINMMTEAQTIAEKLGIAFRRTIEERVAGAEAVGAHKTSMLHDSLAGRPMEVDAVIGAVTELGRITQSSCPTIDSIYACVSLLNDKVQQLGVEQPNKSD
jgi:2-dehydropantoate 2-reductase